MAPQEELAAEEEMVGMEGLPHFTIRMAAAAGAEVEEAAAEVEAVF